MQIITNYGQIDANAANWMAIRHQLTSCLPACVRSRRCYREDFEPTWRNWLATNCAMAITRTTQHIERFPHFHFNCGPGSGVLGGWFFGSPSSPDSNFLRVANAFPNRRLSDNTLMTPKIRIASSCASSPGGTPSGGLPIRRHSSIGPQERRGSAMNLSPPTVRITIYQLNHFHYKLFWLEEKKRRNVEQENGEIRRKKNTSNTHPVEKWIF